jgi:serine/threonine protein kinase
MDVMNGTVSHMAPELLQDKHMSKATDVYSFAVLLWEIAAQGESPFSGIDAVDVITAVVKHDLRPKFAENAFRPLIQLATRCWHADPHERPGFDEIGEELITWKPMVTFPEGRERVVHAHPRGSGIVRSGWDDGGGHR